VILVNTNCTNNTNNAMSCPIRIVELDCSPLVVDYGYEVTDKDLLAQWIADLCLGHYRQIRKIIEQIEPKMPATEDDAIDDIVSKLTLSDDADNRSVYRRDGWLFQMMSWIALNVDLHEKFNKEKIFMAPPHTAPGQHGLDGLAVVLDDKKLLGSIIITEDKCSEKPRNIMTSQIFPEFVKFEKGVCKNRIVTGVTSLIEPVDDGDVIDAVQDDIAKKDYRKYRIGITRLNEHADAEGRKKLFADYDRKVKGDGKRRRASSVYVGDVRPWMADLAAKVIANLNSKKRAHV